MDGIGAARFIRKDERTKNIPIIFVTGYVHGQDTNEVRNIPNCGFLPKPFQMQQLLDMVGQYIGG
ncbi:MAG: hypothetical protein P9M13_05345 [Candidatus Ancaeobacter aquaticus]|nr:hypothetical protein [Candidatus Ancaeobacter aquaticus]